MESLSFIVVTKLGYVVHFTASEESHFDAMVGFAAEDLPTPLLLTFREFKEAVWNKNEV